MVERRRKDPGGSGGTQESQEKVDRQEGNEGGIDAFVGSFNRFTGKIRAEFIVSGRKGNFKAAAEAKKLFEQMIQVDNDIVFKSDTDGRITFRKISEFPSIESKFKEFFTVTSYDKQGKIHVNFQIESKKRLAAMKRDSTFFNYLRESKIWLVEHKYESHALKSIGFVVKKSPTLTNRPQFEAEIGKALNEFVQTAIDEGDEGGITLDERQLTPTLEISGKTVRHVVREGEVKVGTLETNALEIRCEANKADRLKKLLCTADLPSHKFGMFVPYELARTESKVYEGLIREQNKYMAEVTVIPVFGLHTDVIESISRGQTEFDDDDTIKNQLENMEISVRTDDGTEELENIFMAIEPTQRTEDLGKWLFLVKRDKVKVANDIIDKFLIPRATETIAYGNHKDDSDSFKLGIRRANKQSQAMQSYAAALRESIQQEHSNDDHTHDKQNKNTKKRRQIQIEFDVEEFPSLPSPNKTNTTRQQQQKSSAQLYYHDGAQKTTGGTATTCDSSANTGTDKLDFESLKNSIQAQLDMMKLQIDEMKKQQEEARKKNEDQINTNTLLIKQVLDKFKEDNAITRERMDCTELITRERIDRLDYMFGEFMQRQPSKRMAPDIESLQQPAPTEPPDSMEVENENQCTSICTLKPAPRQAETTTRYQERQPAGVTEATSPSVQE